MAVAVVLTVGCGALPSQKKPPRAFVDERIKPLLVNFIQDANAAGRPVEPTKLKHLRVLRVEDDIVGARGEYDHEIDPHNDTAGVCADLTSEESVGMDKYRVTTGERRWREVWISAAVVDNPSAASQFRELVYHELGHCLFGMGHLPAKPHHIMSPAVASDTVWLDSNWSQLVREMFAVH